MVHESPRLLRNSYVIAPMMMICEIDCILFREKRKRAGL
jgi:hypothetical protein